MPTSPNGNINWKKVNKIIKENNISVKALVKNLKIKKETYDLWLKGMISPSIQNMHKLAAYLNVNLKDIYIPLANAFTLKELRILSGLKQSEIAEKLNVPQVKISQWERGVIGVPASKIKDYRELLNLSEEEFWKIYKNTKEYFKPSKGARPLVGKQMEPLIDGNRKQNVMRFINQMYAKALYWDSKLWIFSTMEAKEIISKALLDEMRYMVLQQYYEIRDEINRIISNVDNITSNNFLKSYIVNTGFSTIWNLDQTCSGLESLLKIPPEKTRKQMPGGMFSEI